MRCVTHALSLSTNDQSLIAAQLQRQYQVQNEFPKYHQVVRRLGEYIGENFTVNSIHKSSYLRHIAIYWQTMPEVYLDIQIVQMLTGQQKQTSMPIDQ